MLVVTTPDLHGWEIQRACGEVVGVVLRARPARSGPAGEKSLAGARAEAVTRMLDHTRTKGGNAVVGLRFDCSDLGAEGSEVCAYGTAVVAVPVDEGARQTATALGYGQPSSEQQRQHQQQYPGYAEQYPGYGQQQYDPNQQYYGGQGFQQYPEQPYPEQQNPQEQ